MVHNATHEVTWRAMVVVALMVDSGDAYGHGLLVGTWVMMAIGFGLRRVLV